MIPVIFALMLAAASSLTAASAFAAQATTSDKPVAPVAPAAPVAPEAWPFDFDFDFDFDQQIAKALDAELWKLSADLWKLRELELGGKLEAFAAQLDAQQVREKAQIARDKARITAQQVRDRVQIARDKARRRIPDGWVEATEPYTRSFPVGKGAALVAVNVSGNIQVTPGTSDGIEVNGMKRAWGPNAEQARQRLSDASVEAYATGSRVELRVEHAGRRDGRGVDVEFDIKVPADAAVELRTVSGSIKVVNVNGEVRVQGVSGDLVLEGTSRLAAVKTVSGNVTITNGGADAQLSLATVSGNMTVQTLAARSIDANTVSGNMIVNGWSGDRAHLRTISGDFTIEATIGKGARLEVESHSGNVRLSLPEQPGFDIETHTFSGRVRIDFPIRSEGPIRDNDRGPRSIRGVYGDGSGSVRVQTFSGDLTLTRR